MEAEPINEALVRRAVEAQGLDFHYLAETGSTNADALAHQASTGRDVVAFSEAQSAGRGRRGRQWLSPFARNIYCTIGISKDIPAARQGLLSVVTGIALCRTLRQATGLQVQLKWPNDLLLEGHKLGGILIESRAHTAGRFFFAIGYGLNLVMSADELASLDRPATSIGRNFRGVLDRSALLVATIDAVIAAIREFRIEGVAQLMAEFAGLDAYRDATVELISGEQCISGINRGIDASGQLRLETAQGIELHSAAEISLRAGS
jgi:BirA family transcriptional regulator, biotin operon repressor / biotin---[acetyl-CoA-carboxylase] ligase